MNSSCNAKTVARGIDGYGKDFRDLIAEACKIHKIKIARYSVAAALVCIVLMYGLYLIVNYGVCIAVMTISWVIAFVMMCLAIPYTLSSICKRRQK